MTSERVTPEFLARGNEIGVVSAAFQDGQVSLHLEAFERGMHTCSSNWNIYTDDETQATIRRRFRPQCLDI